jgi:hypothetical protein
MSKFRIFISGLVAGVMLVLSLMAAYKFHAQPEQPAVAGSQAKAIAGKTTAPIQISNNIQAYPDKAKVDLRLPDDVLQNQFQHVVAATTTKASLHPSTVTAVTDTDTGDTTLYIHRDPLPWMARESSTEVDLDYGYKGGVGAGRLEMRLTVSRDLLQLKALHLGVMGSVDQDRSLYTGIRAAVRW